MITFSHQKRESRELIKLPQRLWIYNQLATVICFGMFLLMGFLLSGFLLIGKPAAANQGGQIFLESKADQTEVTIGDAIHYSLMVTRQKGIEVVMPQLGANLGEFEIRDYKVDGPTEKEGLLIQTITYTIAAYDVGTYHIPPIEIRYKTPDGDEKTMTTEEIEIKVKAVAPEKAADIKDIKAPLELKRDWAKYRRVALWVLLALIIGVLLVGGILFYRQRRVQKSQEKLASLPAHEIAWAELEKVWETFLKNNQIKEFHFQLSEIMRQYLSRRYGINALEATTEELLRELHNLQQGWEDREHWEHQGDREPCKLQGQLLNSQQNSLIADFCSKCDLVKFAKYIPQMPETEQVYQMAFQIIDSTRIRDDAQLIDNTKIIDNTRPQQSPIQGKEVQEAQ